MLGGALQDLAWFCVRSEMMRGRNAIHGAPLEGMGSSAKTVVLWEQISGTSSASVERYEEFVRFKTPTMDEAALARRQGGLNGRRQTRTRWPA